MTAARVLSGEARWAVVHGEALDVLRGMPDASADSLVTDPPAGIAFMGREWDGDKGGRAQWVAWLAAIMAECLRVLKPGGHALVWALPRTSHWTATAVEDAGFEVRDVITHLTGQGFPKSLNVSKAIDKAAGAEAARPVVGPVMRPAGNGDGTPALWGGWTAAPMVTAPATPEAAKWDGWGTALKPASEHWILARKPLVGTVAANVIAHGTGAINVDACRVGTAADVPSVHATRAADESGMNYGDGLRRVGDVVDWKPGAGRWPANVVLSHLPECREVGTKRVRGKNPIVRGETVGGGYNGIPSRAPGTALGYASPDGTETVPAFDCAPGCAVAALDEQSSAAGMHSAGRASAAREEWGGSTGFGGHIGTTSGARIGDVANGSAASRFFPTFPAEPGYLYQAKPSRRERNAGCEGLPKRERTGTSGVDRPMRVCVVCDRMKGGAAGNCQCGPTEVTEKPCAPRSNVHPTVKPLALMRWLARLVTPPGGIVLDPFNGSGSTGCACALEGLRYVGIEREAEYVEIARARIAHHEREVAKPAPKAKRPKPRGVPAPPPSAPRPTDVRQLDLLARVTA